MTWQITYRETLRAALCAQPERYRNGHRFSVWAPPALRIPGDDPGVLTLRDFEPAFAYQELEWMLSGDPSLSAASGHARGELVYQLGDAHLYDDQVEAAAQLLDAQPGDRRPVRYPKARL